MKILAAKKLFDVSFALGFLGNDFYHALHFDPLLIPWTNHVSLTLECVAKSVKLPLPNIAVAVKFFLCCEGHWQDSDDIIVMIIAHDLTDRPPLSCTFKCPFLCYHLNTLLESSFSFN